MYSWFLSIGLVYQLSIAFFAGALVSFVLMMFLMFVKNNKVKAYQRQLEKESILRQIGSITGNTSLRPVGATSL